MEGPKPEDIGIVSKYVSELFDKNPKQPIAFSLIRKSFVENGMLA